MAYLSFPPEKTIAAYGCSNTGTAYGTPWAEFLAEKLNHKLILRSSPGANVGMHLEKLNYDLKNSDIDLVVLQLSSWFRLTLGLAHWDYREDEYLSTEDGFRFQDIGFYTFGGQDDDHNFKEWDIKGDGISGIHQFMTYNVQASSWMKRFANQQLYTFISLCKQYNKKLFIYPWYEFLINEYVVPEWSHMLEGVGYVNQHAEDWFKKNKIDCIPNDGHFGTEAHRRLVDEFLYDKIKTFYEGSDI